MTRSIEDIDTEIEAIDEEIEDLNDRIRSLELELYRAEDDKDELERERKQIIDKERADLAWWNEQAALVKATNARRS